ncbi:hypothetical protein RN001_006087 [Aquatica leii]|uniref:Uncharacterized protein n=1 Tax=Aquatica leii TaxID=1421715 RepID=A0AAN7QKR8_9COLE|nr:hypothetical protein RN001_006087 [Aquatica leii]
MQKASKTETTTEIDAVRKKRTHNQHSINQDKFDQRSSCTSKTKKIFNCSKCGKNHDINNCPAFEISTGIKINK